MTTHSRSLNLSGATNFRDLGGYAGLDGRTVRWRRIFRSDHLAGLTPRDTEVLAGLGLARAFDFRGVYERAATPYELSGVVQHPLPIEPTVVQSLQAILAAGRDLTERDAVEVMRQTYRSFVSDSAMRFAELFRHLLAGDAPLVFHCTAGKDRTGVAAALILHALGVPRDLVVDDFLLTNTVYRRPAGAAQTEAPREVLDVLWKVRIEFLDAALQVLDDDYGGTDGYLEQLGVGPRERERLAELYLEP
jgi:protein-tyrosine phosphatase